MIGRIYKISGGGKFYIGSTTQTLQKRLKNHRSKSTEDARKNTPLYKHFNSIGWSACGIELLVEQEFADKREMFEREKTEINIHRGNSDCLNVCTPVLTPDEKRKRDSTYGKYRREQYPERERERVAEWRRDNPDKYAAQVARSVEQQRRKRLLP